MFPSSLSQFACDRTPLPALLLALILQAAAGHAELPHARALDGQYLDLPVQVTDRKGNGAAGTTVTLHCMDRWVSRMPGGWNAFPDTEKLTNQKGECTFRIPRVLEWGEPAAFDIFQPRCCNAPLERLFLVVEPGKGHAGAVSRPLSTEKKPAARSHPAQPRDPWGPPVYLSEKSAPVILKLAKPVTLTGQVTDDQAVPLGGANVSVTYDLRADTRTGAGGEMWHRTESTGRDGRFRFEGLYPRNIRLNLSATGLQVRTFLNGTETEGAVRDFSFPGRTTSLHVKIRAWKEKNQNAAITGKPPQEHSMP